jgi:lysophospholipase L1-like esterase
MLVAALALAGTAVAGVLALAAEFAVRWRERHRDRPTDMMTTLYYRHARLTHGVRRDVEYYGRVRTDSLALRASTPPPAAPETLRVLADGGSTTFDVGVSANDSTWPARLAHLLSTPARHVRVYNAGVPGYFVLDNLIRFERELHRLRPHLVVLLQGHNDLYDALVPGPAGAPDAPDEVPVVAPWTRWLERHSLLYGKMVPMLRIVDGVAFGPVRGEPPADRRASLARGEAQFEAGLVAYVAVARAFGAEVVLVQPVHVSGAAADAPPAVAALWARTFGGADAPLVLEGYARFDAVQRRVAERHGATFLPTHGFGLDSVAFYEANDPIHFNDRGAARMAARLAEALGPRLAARPAGAP